MRSNTFQSYKFRDFTHKGNLLIYCQMGLGYRSR